MTHRVRLWELKAGEARCAPSEPCMHKVTCLRFRAQPKPGVPLADFSTQMVVLLGCLSHLPLPDNDDAP